jgi:hypothetical protein
MFSRQDYFQETLLRMVMGLPSLCNSGLGLRGEFISVFLLDATFIPV